MKEDDQKNIPPTGKPMISNRLPKAFSQPKHLTHKKSHDHQDLSAANEFKNVKKLLSPLKQASPKSSAFRKVIKKLSNFPQIIEKSPSIVHTELLFQSSIKLEEMITLSIIKSSCTSGTVRKSLHAPTFKLYATKEIPVNTLGTRKKLLETLKSWQKIQKQARYLVEVSSSFWNTPEGCVTIVAEYMPGDSLAKLCECVGAIPEKLLRNIAKRVLASLSYLHKKIGPHGAVNMGHILFDREGKCKLSIGLAAKLNNKEENSSNIDNNTDIYTLGSSLISASLGNSEWICDTIPSKCCLFHDLLALQGIPYLNRLSEAFKDFLCRSTNYNNKVTINELLSHSWIISEEIIGADIHIKDLLGMSLVGSKDFNFNSEKQVNLLIESLQVVLPGHNELKNINALALKELSMELGVNNEILYNKIIGISKDS